MFESLSPIEVALIKKIDGNGAGGGGGEPTEDGHRMGLSYMSVDFVPLNIGIYV